MKRILIVEDEPAISDLIEMNLRLAGYACAQAGDGKLALELLGGERFDLVVLDLMLPELDGYALLPLLQKRRMPVIVVSAKGRLSERVKGLELGADDYLVKPFEPLELIARVEALLRRASPDEGVVSMHGLRILPGARRVYRGEEEIALAHREFQLLMVFVRRPGVVFTRDQLLAQVWGMDYLGESRTVDVHVQRLRSKLEWADVIKTVHRAGYLLEPEVGA